MTDAPSVSSPVTGPQAGNGNKAGRAAAFFDLDKTLIQGSSGFQFARAVREAGMISRRRLIGDAVANIKFRLRGATDAESEALRDRVAATLSGVRVRDLDRLGVRVLQRILPRVYPQMLTIAYEHQDAGRPVYIVTAASEDLAVVLARVMNFDGAIGSHLSEIEDGVYTGQATGRFLYNEAKAVAIRKLAEEEDFDLAASYAYSDSVSDLPMLRAVGNPVVVNPDAELFELAREGGWEVLRFDRLMHKLIAAAALVVGGLGAIGAVVVARALGVMKRKPEPEADNRGRMARILRRDPAKQSTRGGRLRRKQ
jgi:HAD superfamily hydrolase (TIGR01490 family)